MLRARAAREPRDERRRQAAWPIEAVTLERRAQARRSPPADPGPLRSRAPERAPASGFPSHVVDAAVRNRVARPTVAPGALSRASSPSRSALPSPHCPLEPDWKDQPRLWGHAYHPMCSYLASFPAALAHAFIARYSRPGDVVLDPFSGRGTTPLQACAEGRIGVGNDLNPLAHVLTAAKVEPPTDARARGPPLRPAARLVARGGRVARARARASPAAP